MEDKLKELEEHLRNMETISNMHRDAGMRILNSGSKMSRKALVRVLEKVLNYPHGTNKTSASPEEDALGVCVSEKLRVVLQQTMLAMELERLKEATNQVSTETQTQRE